VNRVADRWRALLLVRTKNLEKENMSPEGTWTCNHAYIWPGSGNPVRLRTVSPLRRNDVREVRYQLPFASPLPNISRIKTIQKLLAALHFGRATVRTRKRMSKVGPPPTDGGPLWLLPQP
jgi:hypothetical protein